MLDTRKWLKQFRLDRRLTQEEVANLLGYSHSYISKLESGNMPLNNKFLSKFRYTFDMEALTLPQADKITDQLFQNLFLSLSQQDKLKTEHILNELQKLAPISHAKQVTVIFHLYQFYHATLELRISDAQKHLTQLNKNVLQLTSSGLFLYYKAIAYYYILIDQLASAMKALEQAYEYNTEEDFEYHLYSAILYTKLNSISESNKHIDIANQLTQHQFHISKILQIRFLTAINLMNKRRYEHAKEEFNQLLDSPYHKDYMIKTELIYYYLANIYFEQKNYDEALRYLRSAKVNEKETFFKVQYLYLTAEIYNQLNRSSNALDYINSIKKLTINKKYQYKTLILERRIRNQLYTSETKALLQNKIIPFFKNNADFHEKYKCYQLLQDICYQMKMYKQSADYLKQMVVIREKASNYNIIN